MVLGLLRLCHCREVRLEAGEEPVHSSAKGPTKAQNFHTRVYSKESEKNSGVSAKRDARVEEFRTEIHEMKFDKKDAQSEYDESKEDSASKRAT